MKKLFDLHPHRRSHVVAPGQESLVRWADGIVVTATSPGLTAGSVTIPVSTDPAAGVLATAYASVGQDVSF
jgi:hypothetical protein